jgi:phosphoribosyl 1,2-cyclic phosphodiesterase
MLALFILPIDVKKAGAMRSNDLIVRFWGVRGSFPTTSSPTLRYGGNTACVSVDLLEQTLIWDAGTGIIPLGQALVRKARANNQPIAATMLFSHYHHDHTQGFPFFAASRLKETRLQVFGPYIDGSGPGDVLGRVMAPPLFPVRLDELAANATYDVIEGDDCLQLRDSASGAVLCPADAVGQPGEGCARIFALRSTEHLEEVFHYKLEWRGRSVIYATDREGFLEEGNPLIEFARGADVLIHDAQYTESHYNGDAPGLPGTAGYGHSTVRMACQAAELAGVKQLVLFHHAPEYNDDVLTGLVHEARKYFPNTVAAFEGMEIRLSGDTNEPPEINHDFPEAYLA